MAGYGGAGPLTSGDPRTMATRQVPERWLRARLQSSAARPRCPASPRRTRHSEPPAVEATPAQLENASTPTCAPAWSATARSWCRAACVPDLRMLTAEKHSILQGNRLRRRDHGAGMRAWATARRAGTCADIHAYVAARQEDRAAARRPRRNLKPIARAGARRRPTVTALPSRPPGPRRRELPPGVSCLRALLHQRRRRALPPGRGAPAPARRHAASWRAGSRGLDQHHEHAGERIAGQDDRPERSPSSASRKPELESRSPRSRAGRNMQDLQYLSRMGTTSFE